MPFGKIVSFNFDLSLSQDRTIILPQSLIDFHSVVFRCNNFRVQNDVQMYEFCTKIFQCLSPANRNEMNINAHHINLTQSSRALLKSGAFEKFASRINHKRRKTKLKQNKNCADVACVACMCVSRKACNNKLISKNGTLHVASINVRMK